MKKIKLLLAIALLLSSCSTLDSHGTGRGLETTAIDSVHMGDDSKTVVTALGKPADTIIMKTDSKEDTLVYKDSDGGQRAAISITRANQKVTGVTFIPRESEPEFKLDFLLNKKFADSAFDKAPLQICSRDYIPPQVFYVDAIHGVVIVANKHTGEVESIDREESADAVQLIKDIKNCKR